jgi:gas vesicle protein
MGTDERRSRHIFTGLLIGGILGGVAGLLLAPKSGKELRADIKETRGKALKETKAVLGKTTHQVSEARRRARHILSRIKEKGETAPRYSGDSAEESLGEA